MSQPQVKKPNQKKKNVPKNKNKNKMTPKLLVIQNTPAPVAKGVRGSIPDARYKNSKGGKITVCHAELLATVSSDSDVFNVTSFAVNPGLTPFTGWLASIARNYESYKFKKLRFKYVAACPTTVPGQVYLAADFDASDPVPLTEQAISYFQGTRYSAPWNHQEYQCTQDNLNKRKSYYVRSGSLGANQDVVLYDTANFYVATVGTGNNTLGKLWVEYEVEFSTPEFTQTPSGLALSGRLVGDDNFVDVPAISGNLPLVPTVAGNVLTLTSTAPFSGVIGMGVVGTTLTTVSTVAGTGAASVVRNQAANTAATNLSAVIASIWNAPGQAITYTINSPGGVTSVNMRIGQYSTTLG